MVSRIKLLKILLSFVLSISIILLLQNPAIADIWQFQIPLTPQQFVDGVISRIDPELQKWVAATAGIFVIRLLIAKK